MYCERLRANSSETEANLSGINMLEWYTSGGLRHKHSAVIPRCPSSDLVASQLNHTSSDSAPKHSWAAEPAEPAARHEEVTDTGDGTFCHFNVSFYHFHPMQTSSSLLDAFNTTRITSE